jgi:hypothetical protein
MMILSENAEGYITKSQIPAWFTPDGYSFTNREQALYHVITHCKCKRCGTIIEKQRQYCSKCREVLDFNKYLTFPKKTWTYDTPIYSNVLDIYCTNDDIEYIADENGYPLNDQFLRIFQFIHTQPIYLHTLNPYEIYEDLIPEGEDLYLFIEEAFDQLNEKIKESHNYSPIAWEPDDIAVVLYETKLTDWFKTSKYNRNAKL